MPGDERQLSLEMLDVFLGQRPRTDRWRGSIPPAGVGMLRGPGSHNHYLERAAVRLYQPGERGRMEDWWGAYYDRSMTDWMAKEVKSYTYSGMHGLSNVAAYRFFDEHSQRELATQARRWLESFWAVWSACRAPDGSIAPLGMRAYDPGPDNDFGIGDDEFFTTLALEPMAENEAVRLEHLGERNGHEFRRYTFKEIQALRALIAAPNRRAALATYASLSRDLRAALTRFDRGSWVDPARACWLVATRTLRETALPVRGAPASEAISRGWTDGRSALCDLSFAHGQGVQAAWLSKNINGNSPATLGAVWRKSGGWRTVPPEEATFKIRSRFDRSTCYRRSRDELFCHTELLGPGSKPGALRSGDWVMQIIGCGETQTISARDHFSIGEPPMVERLARWWENHE